ncbi:ecto-ADP-ribosyltransferase 4-like [Hypanus sabinus]|uniref:ecto-ADP-ribosyltransferase 4-like n=1 Tax=Hypanus sabinus TaxID=79690 RepID=UPI0028C4CF40|nr:ecto-ADP-ribosyltransferase 4-like [Hypanus sabinus]
MQISWPLVKNSASTSKQGEADFTTKLPAGGTSAVRALGRGAGERPRDVGLEQETGSVCCQHAEVASRPVPAAAAQRASLSRREGRRGRVVLFFFPPCPAGWCEKFNAERAPRPARLPRPPPPEWTEASPGHSLEVQFIEEKGKFASRPLQLSLWWWVVLLPWWGMETKRLVAWLLVSAGFLYLVSWVLEYFGSRGWQESTVRLDMAGDSAGYVFEQSDQSDELAIRCLQEELSRSGRLRRVWQNARWRTELAKVDGLRPEHVMAVNAYTQLDFYAIFNRALRTYGANDSIYATHFRFKCYHYLLSVALEKLRGPIPGSCRETFRGMGHRAVGGNGSEMRFGFFASSSAHYRIAESFGAAAVFTIRSQYGVPIQNFSDFPEEAEVLIPPYEIFRIEYPAGSGVDVVLTSRGRRTIPVRLDEVGGGRVRVSRVTPVHVATDTPEP